MRRFEKNLIKSEVTMNVLRFADEIIMWSEENIAKILRQLPGHLQTNDEIVLDALHELDREGVIKFIGANDIFLVPDPDLLEQHPSYGSHQNYATVLKWVLETRLAQEA